MLWGLGNFLNPRGPAMVLEPNQGRTQSGWWEPGPGLCKGWGERSSHDFHGIKDIIWDESHCSFYKGQPVVYGRENA